MQPQQAPQQQQNPHQIMQTYINGRGPPQQQQLYTGGRSNQPPAGQAQNAPIMQSGPIANGQNGGGVQQRQSVAPPGPNNVVAQSQGPPRHHSMPPFMQMQLPFNNSSIPFAGQRQNQQIYQNSAMLQPTVVFTYPPTFNYVRGGPNVPPQMHPGGPPLVPTQNQHPVGMHSVMHPQIPVVVHPTGQNQSQPVNSINNGATGVAAIPANSLTGKRSTTSTLVNPRSRAVDIIDPSTGKKIDLPGSVHKSSDSSSSSVTKTAPPTPAVSQTSIGDEQNTKTVDGDKSGGSGPQRSDETESSTVQVETDTTPVVSALSDATADETVSHAKPTMTTSAPKSQQQEVWGGQSYSKQSSSDIVVPPVQPELAQPQRQPRGEKRLTASNNNSNSSYSTSNSNYYNNHSSGHNTNSIYKLVNTPSQRNQQQTQQTMSKVNASESQSTETEKSLQSDPSVSSVVTTATQTIPPTAQCQSEFSDKAKIANAATTVVPADSQTKDVEEVSAVIDVNVKTQADEKSDKPEKRTPEHGKKGAAANKRNDKQSGKQRQRSRSRQGQNTGKSNKSVDETDRATVAKSPETVEVKSPTNTKKNCDKTVTAHLVNTTPTKKGNTQRRKSNEIDEKAATSIATETIKQSEEPLAEVPDTVSQPSSEPPTPVAESIPSVDSQVELLPSSLSEITISDDAKPEDDTENTDATEELNDKPSDTNVDDKGPINYLPGQWSPRNLSGKKFYDREQLFALQKMPLCNVKPSYLELDKYLAVSKAAGQQMHGMGVHGMMNGNSGSNAVISTLMPKFANRNSGGNIQGMPYQRRSQGGSKSMQNPLGGPGGSQQGNKPKAPMIISLSLREDVKLNETENAWKPSHLRNDNTMTAEERALADLKRKVRGVLNKLTPEKFSTLLEQIQQLNIDTVNKLDAVVSLVFEKAIDEPNFSVAYAALCERLSTKCCEKDSNETDNKGSQGKPGEKSSSVTFRNNLMEKCRNEVMNHVMNDEKIKKLFADYDEKMKQCKKEDERVELHAAMQEEEAELRRRSVGTVRFVGELFNKGMVSYRVMTWCLDNFLKDYTEERLECLCKLLTTIGETFEKKGEDHITSIFNIIKGILSKKNRANTQISSRVRFMLQDVVDLKLNKWVPRRADFNPKTMSQIQKEADQEQFTAQMLNMMPRTKDDRRGPGGGNNERSNYYGSNSQTDANQGGKGSRGGQSSDWLQQNSKNRPCPVDATKFRSECKIDENIQLGTPASFKWSQANTTSAAPLTTNSFSALDMDKESGPSRNRDSYYNKGSLDRDRDRDRDRYDGRNSRSSSRKMGREQSRDSHSSSGNANKMGGMPPQMQRSSYQSQNTGPIRRGSGPNNSVGGNDDMKRTMFRRGSSHRDTPSLSGRGPESNTAEEIDFNSISIDGDASQAIEKIVHEVLSVDLFEMSESELAEKISKVVVPEHRYVFFHQLITSTMDKKSAIQTPVSNFIGYCVKNDHSSIPDLVRGVYLFAVDASEFDYEIDMPRVWNYLAQMILSPLKENTLHLGYIKQIACKLNAGKHNIKKIENFVAAVFNELCTSSSKAVVQSLWANSNLNITEFELSKDFLNRNNLTYLVDGKQTSSSSSSHTGSMSSSNRSVDRAKSLDRTIDNIYQQFEKNIDYDDICIYINSNIKSITIEFIRCLTRAIVEYTVSGPQGKYRRETTASGRFNETFLHITGIRMLLRYIDHDTDRQLNCLFAIQETMTHLEFPQGALTRLFNELYDNLVISSEIFVKWRESDLEPEGKGVAVKMLHSFYSCMLLEANNSSSEDEKP